MDSGKGAILALGLPSILWFLGVQTGVYKELSFPSLTMSKFSPIGSSRLSRPRSLMGKDQDSSEHKTPKMAAQPGEQSLGAIMHQNGVPML